MLGEFAQFVILMVGELVFNAMAVWAGYYYGKKPLRPAMVTLDNMLGEARGARSDINDRVNLLEGKYDERFRSMEEKISSIKIPTVPTPDEVADQVLARLEIPKPEISTAEISAEISKIVKLEMEKARSDLKSDLIEYKSLTKEEIRGVKKELLEEVGSSEKRIMDSVNGRLGKMVAEINDKIMKRVDEEIEEKADEEFKKKLKMVEEIYGDKGPQGGSFLDRLMDRLDGGKSKKK